MENNKLIIQTLNGCRFAVASVYSHIHPDQPPIASQPEIVRFFKAKKDSEARISTIDKLKTWDVNILMNYIRKEMSLDNLPLDQLQIKAVLLMCINTTWRPRSDVGRLQWRDVHSTYTEKFLHGAILHIRQPKESNMKTIQLELIEEEALCLVRNLSIFMDLTNILRQNLAKDHTLLLGYLGVDKKTSISVKPSTVGQLVQMAMSKTGIDVRYKSHSLRSAASTKIQQTIFSNAEMWYVPIHGTEVYFSLTIYLIHKIPPWILGKNWR
ncbi:hypothetical protein G6F56_002064 [Rhizopus delemar]|nr:hypothetical protein G6F56_002064 [Rhizopus delemar]